MTDKQLFKLALEALELLTDTEQSFGALDYGDNAITALKERLAQPEQEPVDYEKLAALGWQAIECGICGGGAMGYPQRTEQEPVAKYSDIVSDGGLDPRNKFDVSPQRKPLTEEQRQELMSKAWNKWLSRKDDGRLFAWDFSFEVEAAHNIKEKT